MAKGARKGKSEEIIKTDIDTRDFYKHYKEKHCKDRKSKYYIGKTQYTNFIKGFFDEVVDKMIYENYEFKLPYRLGKICIRSYKVKYKFDENGKQITNLPVDWNRTLDLWKRDADAEAKKILVRHLNKHSDNNIYRYFYIRNQSTVTNRYYWWFRPTRNNKIKLKNAIKDGNINFYKI